MENKVPPFYVGQKVVCVKSHSQGAVVEGREYVVRRIKCVCCDWIIDIGIESIGHSRCPDCGFRSAYPELCWWFSASLFAPIDQFKAVTFSKVLETELVSQN